MPSHTRGRGAQKQERLSHWAGEPQGMEVTPKTFPHHADPLGVFPKGRLSKASQVTAVTWVQTSKIPEGCKFVLCGHGKWSHTHHTPPAEGSRRLLSPLASPKAEQSQLSPVLPSLGLSGGLTRCPPTASAAHPMEPPSIEGLSETQEMGESRSSSQHEDQAREPGQTLGQPGIAMAPSVSSVRPDGWTCPGWLGLLPQAQA